MVGHDPLFARGMNAAPAIFEDFVYVGSRTDGSPQHPHPGVLVVDVKKPEEPEVVGEIGPPNEGNVGETSRELRVWREEELLMVLNFGCSSIIHACTAGELLVAPTIKFYDLAEDREDPPLVATYEPSRTPHEFFLWVDPQRPGRALLYMSTPTSSTRADRPNMIVTEITRDAEGALAFAEVAKFNPNSRFSEEERETLDTRLHSLSISADGTRAYLAYLGAGFLIADSSELANDLPEPQVRLVTDVARRPFWGNPGAHSAVPVAGRPLALVTDEVYGDFLTPITGHPHGCPWGWVRLIDTSDETVPTIVGEYRTEQNQPSFCDTPDGRDKTNTAFTSFSSHNPTLVGDLAFVTWHSSGLQAFSVADPASPPQTGVFSPDPLPSVATEDPAIGLGRNKVIMWSYPIVNDGLIYVVDVRNGLYVLRYTGPGADQVAATGFLEGNSNLGDALAAR